MPSTLASAPNPSAQSKSSAYPASLFRIVNFPSRNFDAIGRFSVDRLKMIFEGLAENPLPLRNSRNVPIYLLCFAAANPRGAPVAVKIANHIPRP